jgi:hypothetical protein
MANQLGHRIDPACRAVLDELEARVQGCLGRQVQGFSVVFQNGGLALCGWARTYYAKQLAQELVMAATELPILANDIAVS